MPRKIYDIKPPKIIRKVEKEIKEILTDSRSKKHSVHHKKEKIPAWVKISSGVVIVLLSVCIYLFFELPKADIVIWPKVDVLSFKQTITADKSVDSIDTEKFLIPAQYFQTTKSSSQEFLATGNADDSGKASGEITIYNKYSPPIPFTFRAGTHFLSDSGKLFVCNQKISIPAATKSGSKITPGTVVVKVEAVEGGQDYNIAPSNFSIPGLKGTSYYYSINAVSEVAMEGGYSGKIKKVTENDIAEAKNVLDEKTKADAISELKNQISSDYVLVDNAVFSEISESGTKAKAGDVAEKFEYSVTAKASALVFRKSDLDQIARQYIISKIEDGKTLLQDSLKIDYSVNVIDVTKGTAKINLDFSAGTHKDININSVSLSLLGQNVRQINETITSTFGDQITKINVNFWPFWVNSAPNKQKAINVELKFE